MIMSKCILPSIMDCHENQRFSRNDSNNHEDKMKLNKKLLTTLIALIFATPAFASVAVSPTKIEINANKIKTNYVTTAIEIKGDSKELMRFKAYPGFFTIDNKSEVVMIDKSNDPHDLSKRLRFVPSEFNVAQGKSQKLRINIANLNTLPDGENRAMLYIEDVNPKEMNLNTGHAGIGAQLIVKTRVGVPIYIDKGKITKNAEVEYLNISKEKDGLYTNMKVLATGNSKVRYNAKAQIVQGKKLIGEYELGERVVGANNYYIDKRKINLSSVKKEGEYTLRVVLSYFDEKEKRKNIVKETNLIIKGNV